MKKTNLLIPCFLLVISSYAQNINKTIVVDGLQRNYILHLPPAFNHLDKLPLIFALHGGGGTAQNAVKFYGLEPPADKHNCIIVYPDAMHKAWSIPGMASRVKGLDTMVDDVHFISVLLDTLIAHYKVDTTKVFCTGISRGGMFSFYLATALNERITAIAPVCGGISITMASTYSFKRPLPLLMINGTADPLVNYNGGYGKLNSRNEGNDEANLLPAEELVKKIVSFNRCNTQPMVTILPDRNAYDECTETEYIYDGGDATVDFIKIENGGHTWAGGTQYLPKIIIGRLCKDFSAAEKIIDFFMNR